ncbi:MAG: pyrimidine-nucleoside phosphorylase [Thermoflexales bacterium]|nr:pyrimidine-nucleoside phosphorylase [Thermoflexales bacterium]
MRIPEMIERKRDGLELTSEEIRFFVEGYTRGDIPDYQAAAWCMAVFFRGMTRRETADLTLAMAHSGEMLDLHDIAPIVVDKHSSGGVGDKVSLIVAPLVAASGLHVGKMSGRGLSFSGGTIDKLESIAGFRVNLSEDEFRAQLKTHNIVLVGQSHDLAPADGKLYALRDVTGTVPSLPLIASSIMSKKIAAGADAIVLDVKCGSGAFMKTPDDARRLAETMVGIGHELKRKVTALIGDMDQPLGYAIGNALEVKEAIDTLHGHGPADLTEHSLVIASHMLYLGERAPSVEAGRQLAEELLKSGRAWDKFVEWIVAQGGDRSLIENPARLPQASLIREVTSDQTANIRSINALEVGLTSVDLGAGRAQKDDAIDHAVGIILHVKVGQSIERGQPLFTIHANDQAQAIATEARLRGAIQFSAEPVPPLPLFYGVVS